MIRPGIVCHGGAGWPASQELGEGTAAAARAGVAVLAAGGSALEAVERAITVLEDDPRYDAGTGAFLNLAGKVELDAAIMDGATLKAGAVGQVTNVKNPIQLAKQVLVDTNYILMVGKGAEALARFYGFPEYDPRTPEMIEQWEELLALVNAGRAEEIPVTYRNVPLMKWTKDGSIRRLIEENAGTVGAVALDRKGNIVAGASTGGSPLKVPGRVGSSATVCGGLYADNETGGAAATGNGEHIIHLAVSKTVCDFIRSGLAAPDAVVATLRLINNCRIGAKRVGVIAMDRTGHWGAGVNVDGGLPCAYMNIDMAEPIVNQRQICEPDQPLEAGLLPVGHGSR